MERDNLNKRFGVTEEQLARWAEDAEDGVLPGAAVGPVVMGRPRLYDGEMMQVCFKESCEVVEKIDERARACGKSRSGYIRSLIARDLATA